MMISSSVWTHHWSSMIRDTPVGAEKLIKMSTVENSTLILMISAVNVTHNRLVKLIMV